MELVRETLHDQLRGILREKINNNAYKDKIPSELNLMKEFSVSRATVRLAVSALVQDGLLVKHQGKGTFISDRPVSEWLGHLYGFSETMKQMGFTPTAKTIRSKAIQNEKVSEILGAQDIYLIERIRFVDEIPIAIERAYLPIEIGMKLKGRESEAIYPILEVELGLLLDRAQQSIASIIATQLEAKFLDVSIGAPLLEINRTTYAVNGNPIEVLQAVYRGDYYQFQVDLKRNRTR